MSRAPCTRSWPSTVAVPDVGSSSVASMRMVVVLPAPFGPRIPNTSPVSTRRSMPSTARNVSRWSASRRSRCQIVRRPFSKSLVRPIASIAALTSFHADQDAVAVRILDVEDRARRAGIDRIADALALVSPEAGHELERRIDEADGNAQVHHLPPVLRHANAQLPAAAAGDGGLCLGDALVGTGEGLPQAA